MYSQKYESQIISRQAPGIFTYMELFSTPFLAYCIFFASPVVTGILSMIFNAIFVQQVWDLSYFLEIFFIFRVNICGCHLVLLPVLTISFACEQAFRFNPAGRGYRNSDIFIPGYPRVDA